MPILAVLNYSRGEVMSRVMHTGLVCEVYYKLQLARDIENFEVANSFIM